MRHARVGKPNIRPRTGQKSAHAGPFVGMGARIMNVRRRKRRSQRG